MMTRSSSFFIKKTNKKKKQCTTRFSIIQLSDSDHCPSATTKHDLMQQIGTCCPVLEGSKGNHIRCNLRNVPTYVECHSFEHMKHMCLPWSSPKSRISRATSAIFMCSLISTSYCITDHQNIHTQQWQNTHREVT